MGDLSTLKLIGLIVGICVGVFGIIAAVYKFITWVAKRFRHRTEKPPEVLLDIRESLHRIERAITQPGQGPGLYQNGLPHAKDPKLADLMKSAADFHDSGKPDDAMAALRDAQLIAETPSQRAAILNMMGLTRLRQGRLEDALSHFQQALAAGREADDVAGQATYLNNIGIVYRTQGKADLALKAHDQARTTARKATHPQAQANALGSMGNVYASRSQYDLALKAYGQALQIHSQALEIDRDIGYRQGEAADLANIGATYPHLREEPRGETALRQALSIYEEIGLPHRAARVKKRLDSLK